MLGTRVLMLPSETRNVVEYFHTDCLMDIDMANNGWKLLFDLFDVVASY